MALDNSGGASLAPIVETPNALSAREQERQAFFNQNPIVNPAVVAPRKENTEMGTPAIEGLSPRESLQAIVDDPSIDIKEKEKYLNTFAQAESSKAMNEEVRLKERDSALEPLFKSYEKAVQIANMRGFKPPALPKALLGSSFDPNAVIKGSAEDYIRPTAPQGNKPSDHLSAADQMLLSQNQALSEGNKLQGAVANAELATNKALQNYQTQMEAQSLQFQQKQDEDRLKLEKIMSGVEEKRAAFVSKKVDPNQFWNTKTTGQKIGLAIAAAFAGMGQAMAKQSGNPVLSIIQSRIDADIDAQKNNMMSLKEDIANEQSLYSQYHQLYKDDQSAYYAAQAASLQQTQLMLQAQNQKITNQFTMANAQKLNMEIEEKKQAAYQALATRQRLQQMGGQGNQSVGQKIALISTLPEDQKKQASDELNKSMAHDAVVNQVQKLFKEYEGTATAGRVTGIGKSSELDAQLKSILSQFSGVSPKQISSVVKSLTPGVRGAADIKGKLDTVIEIVNSKKPATPILDAYGLSKANEPDSFFKERK